MSGTGNQANSYKSTRKVQFEFLTLIIQNEVLNKWLQKKKKFQISASNIETSSFEKFKPCLKQE